MEAKTTQTGLTRRHQNHCTALKFLGATILLFSAATLLAAHVHILGNDVRTRPSSAFPRLPSENNEKFKKSRTRKKRTLRESTLAEKTTEMEVLRSVMKRAEWSSSECRSLRDREPLRNDSTVRSESEVATVSGYPFLPEGGVALAIRKWLQIQNQTQIQNKNNQDQIQIQNQTIPAQTHVTNSPAIPSPSNYCPTCSLPPAKSCHVKNYTVVIMSHDGDRFRKMAEASLFAKTKSWKGLTELIFVWNSPRSHLEQIAISNNKSTINGSNDTKSNVTAQFAQQLLRRHDDPADPLRIFFSLEHNLTDNLLNRYHPLLSPRNEALLYFDDDGPFSPFPHGSVMKPALELWKRHSDVQIGGRPRHLSFSSQRIQTALEQEREKHSLKFAIEGNPHKLSRDFAPFCRDGAGGDRATYHRHIFPDFDAYVLLPTGSILHRNYLCFIWHEAFAEMREYVRRHVTRPDDIYVSVLVAQLSGKGARTYARKRSFGGGNSVGAVDVGGGVGYGVVVGSGNFGGSNNNSEFIDEILKGSVGNNIRLNAAKAANGTDFGPNDNTNDNAISFHESNNDDNKHRTDHILNNPNKKYDDRRRHRRLMWESPNWFTYREEAVNSILGYFGSIHPGSVGWCAGTPYMKKSSYKNESSSIGYHCEPEYPPLEYLPWMNEWGIGYRQCP